MPVNTSSTGATYGKSSDPLCPLGFHPQVRWPTRCKRCFRDYKEHSDDKDRARFGNSINASRTDDSDPWNAGRRAGFQKSRSLDVTMGTGSRFTTHESSTGQGAQRSLIGAEIGSAFTSRTTSTSGPSSSTPQQQVSKTDDDIPEWKRNMLQRQAARDRESTASSTPAAPTPPDSYPSDPRNFGFIPGTTLHSSYARPASYAEDARLSSSSTGAANQSSTASSSGSSATSAAPTHFHPAVAKPKSSDPVDNLLESYTSSFSSSSSSKSRLRRAESEDQTLSTSFRSRKNAAGEDEEDYTVLVVSPNAATSKTSKVTFSEPSSHETKSAISNMRVPQKSPAATTEPPKSTSATPAYGSKEVAPKKPESPPAAKPQAAPSWKAPSTAATESSPASPPDKKIPSWKKQATTAPAKPTEEKAPSWKTPSWKQQKEANAEESKPTLGKISEASPSSSSSAKSKLGIKKKSSISESSEDESISSTDKIPEPPSAYLSTTKTSSGAQNAYGTSSAVDVKANNAKVASLESEVDQLKKEVDILQRSNSTLSRERDALELKQGRTTPTSMTFESAKASETAAELLKAKEKIREQERTLYKIETEKKGLNLRVKEMETQMERRPIAAETNKTISELQTKLKYYEKKSQNLEAENNDLTSNVQNLEQEMEEVQDNFREDEVDEYRHLKRDLEATAKNCRVLQFKLKKAEKSLVELTGEKEDLEQKVKSSAGGSSALDNMSKIRQLEKDLDQKNQLNSKLEQQIKELQNTPSGIGSKPNVGKTGSKLGPVLSRTGSIERSVEDQLLKDLQDSIERETDLKEQLTMAEESSTEMRLKMSRLEDETESLASQLKRMTTKTKAGTRRSPSPRVGSFDKDEGISEDGEELSPAELKVQLEVAEGETGLLRKKVENLLTDNLKLSKEIKDINSKLAEEKKKKPTGGLYSSTTRGTEKDNSKLEETQNELNSTRIKLIEKERELERLDAQLKSATKAGGTSKMKRSGSQEEDLQKKLDVIEKEANVLRQRNTALESENEKLGADNKQLHQKYGKKLPSSTMEKLQMDKFALEERVRTLETKEKEQTKEVERLQSSTKTQNKELVEIDRLKREKSSLEYEVTKIKAYTETEKRKAERLEKEVATANEKSEKAQRELISAEREKRKVEDEKMRQDDKYGRLESELRQLTRERDRIKDECETAKQKNRDNLSQTQDGIKAFKDQIETIKKDLQDEKTKHREARKGIDDKTQRFQADMRTVKEELDEKTTAISDLEFKAADLDEKWSKSKRINQQKKEKIDTLEKQLEDAKSSSANKSSSELTTLKSKINTLEKELESKTNKIMELEKAEKESLKKTSGGASSSVSKLETENADLKKEIEKLKAKPTSTSSSWGRSNSSAEVEKELLKQELEDTVAKHELLEDEYVVAKAKLTMERDEMKSEYDAMKNDYGTIKNELTTLRKTYTTKSDEWIKEKLHQQQRMRDLEESLCSSAGEGWEGERDRFKNIIEDRDSQITQLKIEGEVAQSQVSTSRKEIDELKLKLLDYEKMNKFQKVVSSDDKSSQLEAKVDEFKRQLSTEQKERKSEVNTLKMKYDSKTALLSEEIMAIKSQASKYKRERETYKDMMESAQKSRSGRTSAGGDEVSEYKQRVSDLTYQMQVLEDELGDSKLQCSKVNANSTAQKSNYEIQVAELNSKINELEEEALIDSGRARIAGTRTKMELAWQKERESQKKLINELNTMSRDLKSTLLEVEKERDRERLESKRKIDGMKGAFNDENDDTKKQITDLQYDLLELRDAHAKLRTTNEKLRRDKEKFSGERDEYKTMVKERSRGEQGEDKKVSRLLLDMSEFLSEIPKLVGDDIMAPIKPGRTIPHTVLDAHSKTALAASLVKIKNAKEELEQIHKLNEEERERINAKRALMKRTGSVEPDQDSPRGIRGNSSGGSGLPRVPEVGPGRRLSRRAGSVGDTITESDALWKSTDSRGSNESLASNASIPLPVPVRTRSAHGAGGSESGYSSDTYNAMSIRRLERDTSVDRMSTGSRGSGRSGLSTQSEWVAGEKKKKAGLIGKLKKLTRKSEEKEFGSGSDISDVSKTSIASSAISGLSAFQKVQQKRGSSRERSRDRAREPPKNPEEANQPFDKLFGGASGTPTASSASRYGASVTMPSISSSSSSTNSSTLPRSYRRF